MSLLEAAAVAFGIVSVYLSTKQKIWSWPTAIVNVLLYTVADADPDELLALVKARKTVKA